MVVRTHGNLHAVHIVLHAVVERIYENIGIVTSHCFMDYTLCLACAEAGAIRIDEKCFSFLVFSPLLKIPVYIGKKFFRAFHSNNTEFAEIFAVHKSYRTLP